MNHLLTPSQSTFPVQDKFGNVQMFTGLTKLEYAAILIYSQNWEIQAPDAVDLAITILNAVQDKMIEMAKEMQEKNSQIISGK